MEALVFVGSSPLGPVESVELWNGMLAVELEALAAKDAAEEPGERLFWEQQHDQPAGTPAQTGFIRSFFPFSSHHAGDRLFMDPRAGTEQHRVAEWTHGLGDETQQFWPSLEALLAHVNASVRSTETINGWTPEVDEDGTLDWG